MFENQGLVELEYFKDKEYNMKEFQQTSIWQRTLSRQLDSDKYEKERNFLRVEFENFRDKSKLLASEIANKLPEYTVHDISHIDALWDTAELIVPKDYPINPAEAFVLGGAFLLHDLGMALAAYPNGIYELKKEQIWIDTAASILKEKYARKVTHQDLLDAEDDIVKRATEKTLRLLHAKKAEQLAKISWKNDKNQDVFLIDNDKLRNSFGNIIGLIAHSHWWRVDELENKLPPTLGALADFCDEWTIDPLKLACILRIADAMQIDDRRSPSFLRVMRKPSMQSALHWIFQEKMYQPRLEDNRLVYTSKSPFSINEVESWWICYDTLQMIDKELREVDALLLSKHKLPLEAIGISSVEDTKRLSKLITVQDWQPIDTKIRVNNVSKLVNTIGGSQLYGDNILVPLRELIQNSSDAIRARRLFDNENEDYGDICVHIGKDEKGNFIEVEDNGIGMSQRVLTGPFLDFGQSFWGTELMHEELPSLESKGFFSTGKYGIGFFSLFMWSNKIQVITNRCGESRDKTLVLEFNDGAISRPVLRTASECEYLKNGGTKIRVWVKGKLLDRLTKPNHNYKAKKVSFAEIITKLCPSIDCNIYVNEKDKKRLIIKANDWITMDADKLLVRLAGKSLFSNIRKKNPDTIMHLVNNIELLKDENGTVIGRAALYSTYGMKMNKNYFSGIVTVGGFATTSLTGIVGILKGNSDRASRDIGIPIVSQESLAKWARNQVNYISETSLNEELQLEFAEVSRRLCSDTGELKVTKHKDGILSCHEIKTLVEQSNYEEYILIQDASVSIYERDNSCKIDFNKNVFWCEVGSPGIFQTKSINNYVDWPSRFYNTELSFYQITLEGAVIESICEVWNCSLKDIIKISSISSDEKSYSAHIGKADGKDVILDHVSIIKKPKK